jgi:4-carboxymuconolactone decarboxylase
MPGPWTEKGLKARREVLSPEYVDNALRNVDEFSAPLQEMLNEYCWGWLWNRETLPRKTRSIINIALLSVLNRPHELKAHVKGALRNGCSKEEIREVLLHVGVYAGVPAAVDGFRNAREALKEAGA